MEHKLRILFSSNGQHTPTGYAQQMAYLLPLIRNAGYKVAISSFYGLEGGVVNLDGVWTYPKMSDPYGVDAMLHHGNHYNADVVISMQDIWTLDMNILKGVKRFIPIVFADHDPINQITVDRARMAYRLISCSKFGEQQLYNNGLYSTYIPCGVDTTIFKPRDKSFRKTIKVPDDFYLFGLVGDNKDNPPRKSFQEALDAFALFHQRHEKSAFYFHSLPQQAGGFRIDEYAKVLGLQDFVKFPDPYKKLFHTTKEEMSYIFSALDCYVGPSVSEGFCVPVVEAQSCGVPVIVNNFSAQPELVKEGVTGEYCKVAYKRFTGLLSFVGVPDVRSIYDAMEKIYKADRKKMGEDARAHIIENYDIKHIFHQKWVPFLEQLEKEIYP